MLKKTKIIWIFILFFMPIFITPPKIIAQQQDYVESQQIQIPESLLQQRSQSSTQEEVSNVSFEFLRYLFGLQPSKNTPSEAQSHSNIALQKSADFPIQLVNQIKNTCIYNGQPGAVNNNNVSCLDTITISTRGILKESTIAHGALQCVGFVRAIVIETTGSDVCLTAGSALECANDNAYIFIYANSGKQIQTGDLPIWDFPPYGHIAYVTKVNGSKYFDVAEANFTNGGALYRGSVQIRHATTNEPGLIGWLTKKI